MKGRVLESNAVSNFSHKLFFVVLALIAFNASAQAGQIPSLCATSEEVVFSCDLQRHKTVSFCTSHEDEQQKDRFNYVFGTPSHIELKFSSQNSGDHVFSRSRWLYANTFGQAYSFISNGYKYILVSIEDSANQRGNSRLLVQRIGEAHAVREMTCKPLTVIKTKNNNILRRIENWPIDSDIEGHGPPSTR